MNSKRRCMQCESNNCKYSIRFIDVKIYKDDSISIKYGLVNTNGEYLYLSFTKMEHNYKYLSGNDLNIPDHIKFFIDHSRVGTYKSVMNKSGFVMYYRTGLCNTPHIYQVYNQFIKWCNMYIYKGSRPKETRREETNLISDWLIHFPKNINKEEIEYKRNQRFLKLKHNLVKALYNR